MYLMWTSPGIGGSHLEGMWGSCTWETDILPALRPLYKPGEPSLSIPLIPRQASSVPCLPEACDRNGCRALKVRAVTGAGLAVWRKNTGEGLGLCRKECFEKIPTKHNDSLCFRKL